MNLKQDISRIIVWLHAAMDKEINLINDKDYINALDLINDIRYVLLSYLQAMSNMSSEDLTPFPKNFFSQISWIGKNINWLRIITSGNPFEAPAKKAETVAAKWNLEYK